MHLPGCWVALRLKQLNVAGREWLLGQRGRVGEKNNSRAFTITTYLMYSSKGRPCRLRIPSRIRATGTRLCQDLCHSDEGAVYGRSPRSQPMSSCIWTLVSTEPSLVGWRGEIACLLEVRERQYCPDKSRPCLRVHQLYAERVVTSVFFHFPLRRSIVSCVVCCCQHPPIVIDPPGERCRRHPCRSRDFLESRVLQRVVLLVDPTQRPLVSSYIHQCQSTSREKQTNRKILPQGRADHKQIYTDISLVLPLARGTSTQKHSTTAAVLDL